MRQGKDEEEHNGPKLSGTVTLKISQVGNKLPDNGSNFSMGC
jgi:hypothetical protein